MSTRIPPAGFKGRGALANPANRFDRAHTEATDDGWFQDELPASIATELRIDTTRSIIARNDSPDIASTSPSIPTGLRARLCLLPVG